MSSHSHLDTPATDAFISGVANNSVALAVSNAAIQAAENDLKVAKANEKVAQREYERINSGRPTPGEKLQAGNKVRSAGEALVRAANVVSELYNTHQAIGYAVKRASAAPAPAPPPAPANYINSRTPQSATHDPYRERALMDAWLEAGGRGISDAGTFRDHGREMGGGRRRTSNAKYYNKRRGTKRRRSKRHRSKKHRSKKHRS